VIAWTLDQALAEVKSAVNAMTDEQVCAYTRLLVLPGRRPGYQE
jgi:hypothetical protein